MKLRYGPYSPSRLEAGLCGHTFYHNYVAQGRVKRPGSVPQDRGNVVHEVFERMTARQCAAIAEAEKNGMEAVPVIFNPQEIRGWVSELVTRYPAAYSEVGEILYAAKLYAEKPPRILTADAGIELRLAVKRETDQWKECSYDDPDAFFRGKADIMVISDDLKTAVVYDHKTQMNIEEADTFQMGCYAWVISKIHPYLEEIHTILHFARFGYYSQPYVWDRESLAKIEDELLTRVEIIEGTTQWVATPNKLCQYCPLIATCPAMQEFLEPDVASGSFRVADRNFAVLGDTNKAVRLAGGLAVVEEWVSEAKKALKEHVKLYGPVAIPGIIYEFKAADGIDWDRVNKYLRTKTYEIFAKHNVDPKMFMSFNQTTSKAIWMAENETLIRELADLFPKKVTTTFSGYKA